MARTPTLAEVAMTLVVALGAGTLVGCLDDEADPNRPALGDTFVPFPRDFVSFRSWMRIEVAPPDAAPVPGAHLKGPRYVYLNGAVDHGAFAVGTIIVKTAEIGPPQSWEIHARAKRGGDFNPRGAMGWEWFDLQITPDDEVVVMWGAEKPPANHGYESLDGMPSTDADCNSCHGGAAQTTDYILAPQLQAMLTAP